MGTNFRKQVYAAGILLVCEQTRRILLLKRGKGSSNPGTWSLPGGKLEKLEFPREAGIREIFEETGFDTSKMDISLFDISYSPSFIFYSYLLYIPNEVECTLNEENSAFGWFNFDQLSKISLHYGVKDMLEKIREVI